jgi:hypothetical protein
MAKKLNNRKYPMSDGDLLAKARLVSANVNRDLAFFAPRNVTGTSTLDTLAATFDTTPTDEELVGALADASITKKALAEEVKAAIRPIRNMAALQFGTGGNYQAFGFTGMAALDANGLYRMANRVVRVGTALLPALGVQGLSSAQLTALAGLNTSFDAAIDAVMAAEENRMLQTGGRVAAGNTLWAEMARLCSIGKSIFEAADAVKYRQYVLWDKPRKKRGKGDRKM